MPRVAAAAVVVVVLVPGAGHKPVEVARRPVEVARDKARR